MVVFINYFVFYWDIKYWIDLEKFDLLCFLDENGKMDFMKLDSWLLFFVGRRVCFGEFIVKLEILMMCVYFF